MTFSCVWAPSRGLTRRGDRIRASISVEKNLVLKSLTAASLNRVLQDMDEVEVPYGTVLYSTGEKIRYVYFPEHAMISIVAHTEEGQSAEVGLIGFEGLIGLDYLLGAENAFNDHVAKLAGKVLRLKAAAAKKEFRRGGDFHDLVTRFTRHYLLQISQTALCNRLHSLEERLARWILMSDDRSTTDRIALTHELLSIMVGATRASVTRMAIGLQKAGYFTYSRGSIRILDRKGLEDFTCECYKTVLQACSLENDSIVDKSSNLEDPV